MTHAGLLAVGLLALTSCSTGRAAPPGDAGDNGWRWTGRIVHAHLSDSGRPC